MNPERSFFMWSEVDLHRSNTEKSLVSKLDFRNEIQKTIEGRWSQLLAESLDSKLKQVNHDRQSRAYCCIEVYLSLDSQGDNRLSEQGLFRSASQLKQADFLARDFKQQKHKEAACKNAFVLLGQHKHELAAAFFILGMLLTVASPFIKIPCGRLK